ncbi:site-specific integrase [Pseudomonas aeruginosa]|uniref:site-specific integrase n=1 Tax=Pseudomonas aeruginosa TaxID=287 RepID=UPI0009AA1FE1|nr:site-specific integrase [Pseudomonas aeruginosa]MCT5519264.1 site-specific integrase [Pseudomonas aeruginosa]MEE2515620.1 site-specific integrase [Pseudomonas aeruginosa]HEJ1327401.1 site-specific integrase [Pseudomonas aeruginosa]
MSSESEKASTPFDGVMSAIQMRWQELYSFEEKFFGFPVSKLSTYEKLVWDMRADGSPYRIDFESLLDFGWGVNYPLLVLYRAVAKSLLGSDSIVDRATRTVHNIIVSGKDFARWLVSKGLFVSGFEGGYFGDSRDVLPFEFDEFFRQIANSDLHWNTRLEKARFAFEWWRLSNINGALPHCLRLSYDPFQGRTLSSYLDESVAYDDDAEAGWQTIPLEYAFPLAAAAIDYIENYGNGLIRWYNVVDVGVHSTNKSTVVSRSRVIESCGLHGISLDQLSSGLPFTMKIVREKSGIYRLHRREAEESFKTIKHAALVILLFTTGLRRKELQGLKVGCCVPDLTIGVDEFYRLTFTVTKTSAEYIVGQVVSIPVPKVTYDAIRVLEQIGSLRRRGDALLTPHHSNEKRDHVNDKVCGQTIQNWVSAFAAFAKVGYDPHIHQFRKTIAGWFLLNSPVLGPLLVMLLFSHKSLAMTEKYFRNNPLIIEERKAMLIKHSLPLAKRISVDAQEGSLYGPMGQTIENAIKTEIRFQGLTGDQLGASIEEYLRERALNQSMHFLLTPLAVCAFNPNNRTELPCSLSALSSLELGDDDRTQQGCSVPIVGRCVGSSCNRCLVTRSDAAKIDQSLDFYKDLLSGAINEDYARNIHFIDLAKNFVEKHQRISVLQL